jgi:hypothetical protein
VSKPGEAGPVFSVPTPVTAKNVVAAARLPDRTCIAKVLLVYDQGAIPTELGAVVLESAYPVCQMLFPIPLVEKPKPQVWLVVVVVLLKINMYSNWYCVEENKLNCASDGYMTCAALVAERDTLAPFE